MTPLAAQIVSLARRGEHAAAEALRPVEPPYPLPQDIAARVAADEPT